MTNGDKIRAMTDEELSKYISDLSVGNWRAKVNEVRAKRRQRGARTTLS